jgi:hypothetical protein
MKIHEIFRQPLSPEDYRKVQQIIEFYVEKGILKKEHYKILKNIEEKIKFRNKRKREKDEKKIRNFVRNGRRNFCN